MVKMNEVHTRVRVGDYIRVTYVNPTSYYFINEYCRIGDRALVTDISDKGFSSRLCQGKMCQGRSRMKSLYFNVDNDNNGGVKYEIDIKYQRKKKLDKCLR